MPILASNQLAANYPLVHSNTHRHAVAGDLLVIDRPLLVNCPPQAFRMDWAMGWVKRHFRQSRQLQQSFPGKPSAG